MLAARPKQLRKLDEDGLIDLHSRMRRARNKCAKLYRSRGRASKKHARAAAKAEIFEEELSRVSRRLAMVARRQAEALRDERLTAAGGTTPPESRWRTPRDTRKGDGNPRARGKRPIERRNGASSRASRARKNAKAGR